MLRKRIRAKKKRKTMTKPIKKDLIKILSLNHR
jgi:hypothetical protein